jgi:hypothetical protein
MISSALDYPVVMPTYENKGTSSMATIVCIRVIDCLLLSESADTQE